MKILMIEDDNMVAESLTLALTSSGYLIDRFSNALDAEIAVATEAYDIVILDLGLPGISGIDFLKKIRHKKVLIPVLILTAKDSYEERIEGLDCGANDYVTKPFHLGELEARIRALLRIGYNNATIIKVGELTFDTSKRTLRRGDELIDLSPREYQLLEIFIHNIGSLITKEKMVSLLSNWEAPVSYNALDITVHRLRKKLEPYGFNLQTIRGLGFIVEP